MTGEKTESLAGFCILLSVVVALIFGLADLIKTGDIIRAAVTAIAVFGVFVGFTFACCGHHFYHAWLAEKAKEDHFEFSESYSVSGTAKGDLGRQKLAQMQRRYGAIDHDDTRQDLVTISADDLRHLEAQLQQLETFRQRSISQSPVRRISSNG
jgi:hypothetical protein